MKEVDGAWCYTPAIIEVKLWTLCPLNPNKDSRQFRESEADILLGLWSFEHDLIDCTSRNRPPESQVSILKQGGD